MKIYNWFIERTQIGNLVGRLTAERLFLIKSSREQNLLKPFCRRTLS